MNVLLPSYLLTPLLEAHDGGGDAGVPRRGHQQPPVLLQLVELEEALLVQLDPPLEDAQQHFQRGVLQRRLDDVQQSLVLDEPLLDLVDPQGKLPLVRLGNGRSLRNSHGVALWQERR